MFRKLLILMTIVLVFLAVQVKADPDVIDSNWVDGSRGQWGDAYNWNPAIVPDNTTLQTFNVTVNSSTVVGGEITVSLQQSRRINQLDLYGEIDVDSGTPYLITLTLDYPNGLRNYGYLKIHGNDAMEILGNIQNTPGASLSLHNLIIKGNVINQSGAIADVDKGEVQLSYGNLENEGIIIIVPMCSLLVHDQVHNTGQININGGELAGDEVLDNSDTGVISGFGVLYGGSPLLNKGKIYARGGMLTIVTDGVMSNSGIIGNTSLASLNVFHIGSPEDTNNSGTIEVNAGGGVAFDCNLKNEPNAIIKLIGGTLSATTITQAAGATFEGQGDISTDKLLIETDGFIRLNGPTNIFGDVEINPNGTLEISDGLTLVKGETTCNGTIHMKGGWLIPQGGISGECEVMWEPGLYTNVADFNLDGKVDFKDFSYFANTWLWKTSWF